MTIPVLIALIGSADETAGWYSLFAKPQIETDANTVVNEATEKIKVPIGMIIAFAGPVNKIPKGWLLCDGSRMRVSDNEKLFNAIGWTWGGDEGGDTFYLPALNGMFLRGVDDGARDPDVGERKHPKTGEVIGGRVGSVQENSLQNHTHRETTGHLHWSHVGEEIWARKVPSGTGESSGFCTYYRGPEDRGWAGKSKPTRVDFDNAPARTVVTLGGPTQIRNSGEVITSSETRPMNAYVYWIIKAK